MLLRGDPKCGVWNQRNKKELKKSDKHAVTHTEFRTNGFIKTRKGKYKMYTLK